MSNKAGFSAASIPADGDGALARREIARKRAVMDSGMKPFRSFPSLPGGGSGSVSRTGLGARFSSDDWNPFDAKHVLRAPGVVSGHFRGLDFDSAGRVIRRD